MKRIGRDRGLGVAADGKGLVGHALLEHFSTLDTRRRRVRYTVGWEMTADEAAIAHLPQAVRTEAVSTDGTVQHRYWIVELTDLSIRPGWPADMRLIVRRVRPSRRQVENMADFERATGRVYSVQAINMGRQRLLDAYRGPAPPHTAEDKPGAPMPTPKPHRTQTIRG